MRQQLVTVKLLLELDRFPTDALRTKSANISQFKESTNEQVAALATKYVPLLVQDWSKQKLRQTVGAWR
jgi:hypothetical protein